MRLRHVRVTVPADYLWVMGDNRSNSADSRAHMGDPGGGTIPIDHVVGTAFATVWPLDHWKGLGNPSPRAPARRRRASRTASRWRVSLAHESRPVGCRRAIVAGIDEVGRGALAGPVSVGLVAVSRCDAWPDGLADSKQLTPARARGDRAMRWRPFGVGAGRRRRVDDEIDDVGIIGALRLAALRALAEIAAAGVVVDAVLSTASTIGSPRLPHDLFAAAASDDAGALDAASRRSPWSSRATPCARRSRRRASSQRSRGTR